MEKEGVARDVSSAEGNELHRGHTRVRGEREALSRRPKEDGASSPGRVRDGKREQWVLDSGERPASERESGDPHRARGVMTDRIRREMRSKNVAEKNGDPAKRRSEHPKSQQAVQKRGKTGDKHRAATERRSGRRTDKANTTEERRGSWKSSKRPAMCTRREKTMSDTIVAQQCGAREWSSQEEQRTEGQGGVIVHSPFRKQGLPRGPWGSA